MDWQKIIYWAIAGALIASVGILVGQASMRGHETLDFPSMQQATGSGAPQAFYAPKAASPNSVDRPKISPPELTVRERACLEMGGVTGGFAIDRDEGYRPDWLDDKGKQPDPLFRELISYVYSHPEMSSAELDSLERAACLQGGVL